MLSFSMANLSIIRGDYPGDGYFFFIIVDCFMVIQMIWNTCHTYLFLFTILFNATIFFALHKNDCNLLSNRQFVHKLAIYC